jgi:hypothetical protein
MGFNVNDGYGFETREVNGVGIAGHRGGFADLGYVLVRWPR